MYIIKIAGIKDKGFNIKRSINFAKVSILIMILPVKKRYSYLNQKVLE